MQKDNTVTAKDTAKTFTKALREHFGDRVDNFSIYNLIDTPHQTFSVDFQAYKYFIITLTYDRGSFGCAINYGKSSIGLDNSQQWFDKADMNVFLRELEQQLELRIPDKFLEFNGWK